MSDLLSMTSSCTRPYIWTTKQKHCGVCSQCIDRRFGILAAGMAEFEPAENYRIELLKGDRSSKDDLRMALSYVSFFKKVGSTTKERFLADFPEVVSALGSFDQLRTSLFPAEQARIVRLLVDRVTIGAEGIAVDLRNDGLGSVVRDMITPRKEETRA